MIVPDKSKITLTAQLGTRAYNITYKIYNADGTEDATTSTSNPASYTVTDSGIALAKPEKSGYDFVGWKTLDETGETKTGEDLIAAIERATTSVTQITGNDKAGGASTLTMQVVKQNYTGNHKTTLHTMHIST